MNKIFYVANRKPDFSPAAFQARWRQHGALATKQPAWRTNMLTYVQSDRVRTSCIAEASDAYDGVGWCLLNHPDLLRAPTPDDDAIAAQLPGDELQTFSGLIKPRLMFAEQEVLLAGGGGTACYLAFADVATAEAVAAPHADRPELIRVVLNRLFRDDSIEPPFNRFAAIVELCAADETRLAAALQADANPAWRKAELILVTRETLLWGEWTHINAGQLPHDQG